MNDLLEALRFALPQIFDLGTGHLIALILIGVAIVVLIGAAIRYRRQAKRGIGADLSLMGVEVDELEGMKKTGLLYDEELKKIRHTMAAQFLQKEDELSRPQPKIPVEEELIQAELEARKMPPEKPKALQAQPKPPKPKSEEPEPEPPSRKSPEEPSDDYQLPF